MRGAARNVRAIFVLALLLALPAFALRQFPPWLDWRIVVTAVLVMSLVTALAYRNDKRQAAAGGRRIPEATLQLLALLGGWPGAFLAQRWYHHKTAKLSFQAVFWMIVLLYQFTALDSLLDWRITKHAMHAIF